VLLPVNNGINYLPKRIILTSHMRRPLTVAVMSDEISDGAAEQRSRRSCRVILYYHAGGRTSSFFMITPRVGEWPPQAEGGSQQIVRTPK
jgi:hypothetical protein